MRGTERVAHSLSSRFIRLSGIFSASIATRPQLFFVTNILVHPWQERGNYSVRYMKSKLLLVGLFLVTLPCSAYSARFVLMTPETKDQSDFQPWLYHAFKAPETVIVAVPYHKGDKKYWLVRANRTLSEDELNMRTIIHDSHNSRPLPDHIESVSKLSPYGSTDASSVGEAIGLIYVRIRRDALKNYYVVHDFPDGVDDGGDYRTYKLAAYAIDSYDLGQDRISEYFKARRLVRDVRRESFPEETEESEAVPSDGHKPSNRAPSEGPDAPADGH